MNLNVFVNGDWAKCCEVICPSSTMRYSNDVWTADNATVSKIARAVARYVSSPDFPMPAGASVEAGMTFIQSGYAGMDLIDAMSSGEYKQTVMYQALRYTPDDEIRAVLSASMRMIGYTGFSIEGDVQQDETDDSIDEIRSLLRLGFLTDDDQKVFFSSDCKSHLVWIARKVAELSGRKVILSSSTNASATYSMYDAVVIGRYPSDVEIGASVMYGKPCRMPRVKYESKRSDAIAVCGDVVTGAGVILYGVPPGLGKAGLFYVSSSEEVGNVLCDEAESIGTQAYLWMSRKFSQEDYQREFDTISAKYYSTSPDGDAALNDVYAKYYGRRFVISLMEKKIGLSREIERLNNHLQSLMQQYADVCVEVENAKGATAEDCKPKLMSSLSKLDGMGIVKVVFAEDGVMAFTDTVYCIHPETRKRHVVGRCIITFPYTITKTEQILVANTTNVAFSNDAAHVYANQGAICFGTLHDAMSDAIRRHDIVDIIYMMRDFLNEANIHDHVGERIKFFPTDDTVVDYNPPKLSDVVFLKTKIPTRRSDF